MTETDITHYAGPCRGTYSGSTNSSDRLGLAAATAADWPICATAPRPKSYRRVEDLGADEQIAANHCQRPKQ
jgi:hypothetical protein